MKKTDLKTLENEVKTLLIKEGFNLIGSNILLVERTVSYAEFNLRELK